MDGRAGCCLALSSCTPQVGWRRCSCVPASNPARMDVSALTASMGVEIAVVFVKQTHSRNGISRRAGLRRNPLSVLPAPRAQNAPKISRLSLLQRAVYGDFARSNSPMAVLLLVVLQLAGPDSDCTKGRRPNLDEGGRLATPPKMDGFGVGGLGCLVSERWNHLLPS